MKSLGGPISNRLRKLFSKDDPVWDPPRKVPAPSSKAVRAARGRGMGDGANRSDKRK